MKTNQLQISKKTISQFSANSNTSGTGVFTMMNCGTGVFTMMNCGTGVFTM